MTEIKTNSANNSGDLEPSQRPSRIPNSTNKLRRSKDNCVIAGLMGGIAKFTGGNPKTLRVIAALSLFFTGGISGLGYLILWLLIPRET